MPKRTWDYPSAELLEAMRTRIKQALDAGHTMTAIVKISNISPPTHYKLMGGEAITTEMYSRYDVGLTALGFPAELPAADSTAPDRVGATQTGSAINGSGAQPEPAGETVGEVDDLLELR